MLKMWPDTFYTRRLKAHFIVDANDEPLYSSAYILDLFDNLHRTGQNAVMIQDEKRAYRVEFVPATQLRQDNLPEAISPLDKAD